MIQSTPLHALFPEAVVTAGGELPRAPGAAFAEELEAVAQASPKRQRDFLAGRLYAHRALDELGATPAPLLAHSDRTPRWPADVVGSISHCEGYCAVAVARRSQVTGVGLDVERGGPLGRNITPIVCTAYDLAQLPAAPPPAPHDWAKLLFCAKEAFYKCYYPLARQFLEFADVHVTLRADGTFSAQLVRADAPSAAGTRELQGRWASTPEHVFAGITLLAP